MAKIGTLPRAPRPADAFPAPGATGPGGTYETVGQVRDRLRCPCCLERIRLEDFKDDLSFREFGISGMCQTCQDEVFD